MTHAEFRAAYYSRLITVRVDQRLVKHLIDYLPKSRRVAHYCWTWLWYLLFPLALYLLIVGHWLIAIALVLLALTLFRKAIEKSACQLVVESALEDERVYKAAMAARLTFPAMPQLNAKGALIITPVSSRESSMAA